MKRFLLFTCFQFYPNGGWNDFRGDFDTLEKAVDAWNNMQENGKYKYDHGHIIDTKTKEVVEYLPQEE